MLKPTKVKIVKKIYSFSPSREGCILVLRVEDVRSKQNEIGINWGGGGVQRSINRQQPMGSNSYYVLCRYVCAVRKLLLRKTELSYYLVLRSSEVWNTSIGFLFRSYLDYLEVWIFCPLFVLRLFGSQIIWKFGFLSYWKFGLDFKIIWKFGFLSFLDYLEVIIGFLSSFRSQIIWK